MCGAALIVFHILETGVFQFRVQFQTEKQTELSRSSGLFFRSVLTNPENRVIILLVKESQSQSQERTKSKR